jgi:hypothetical protein
MFLYHWFAGSALNTAECCSCYGFDDGAGGLWNQTGGWDVHPAHFAKPNGEMLKEVFSVYSTHDRGIPYTPLAIMLDEGAGFGGSICSPIDRQQWGVFRHSPNDQAVYDLLNEQLLSCAPDCQFPHIGANLSRGETMQLRASPYGEFYDVLQSDARSELLALYPTLLLVGDIDFTRTSFTANDSRGRNNFTSPTSSRSSLLTRIATAAAGAGSTLKRVMILHDHAQSIGAADLASFRTSLASAGASLEVLPLWNNPTLQRIGAISDSRLASLAAELNLVNVSSVPFEVQWLTNRLDNGDVAVFLANNKGVAKPPCAAQAFDSSRAVTVTVAPTKFKFTHVEEWLGGIQVVTKASSVEVALGPGDAAILHFSVST